MNIFKGLLFLEGHLTASRFGPDKFAPKFGNKVASARAFANPFASPSDAAAASHPVGEACSAACCG